MISDANGFLDRMLDGQHKLFKVRNKWGVAHFTEPVFRSHANDACENWAKLTSWRNILYGSYNGN